MPRRSLALLLALGALACRDGARPAAPPPVAEFLVAAGDSTYWVSTEDGRVRVRRSPMFLAPVGGRFHEVYVANAEQRFEDAVFASQAMFARDLATGDSTLLLADEAVAEAAAAWLAAHPGERPLDDEEPGAEDPGTVVEGQVELVDVHGPFVSYEQHLDDERVGERPARATRRGVVDLRSGVHPSLAALFGDTAGRRIAAEGRQHFSAALDSVLSARDTRAALAVDALGDFVFDSTSFAIADVLGRPAVAFLAPGAGEAAGGLTLPLPTVDAPAPAWWDEVRRTLPASAADSVERWAHGRYEVVARYDSAGEGLRLVIAAPGARREWPVARMQAPVYHVYRLDLAGVDSVQRRALRRAFDESVLYDEGARTARGPRRTSARPLVRLASHGAGRAERRPVRRGPRAR